MPGYHQGHWREHTQAKDEHWRQVLAKESRFRFSQLPENHDFRRGLSMYLSKPGAGFNFTGDPLLGVPAVPFQSIRNITTAPDGVSRSAKRTEESRRSTSSQSWRSAKGDQIRSERLRLTGENARLREEIERIGSSRVSSSAQSSRSSSSLRPSFSRATSTPPLLGMTKETADYCTKFGAQSYSAFVPTHTEKGNLFKTEGKSLAVLAGHPKSRTSKFGNHNYTGYHMASHLKRTKKAVFEPTSAAALEEFEEELALPPNYHMASLGMF